jgi:hypothetical protein
MSDHYRGARGERSQPVDATSKSLASLLSRRDQPESLAKAAPPRRTMRPSTASAASPSLRGTVRRHWQRRRPPSSYLMSRSRDRAEVESGDWRERAKCKAGTGEGAHRTVRSFNGRSHGRHLTLCTAMMGARSPSSRQTLRDLASACPEIDEAETGPVGRWSRSGSKGQICIVLLTRRSRRCAWMYCPAC